MAYAFPQVARFRKCVHAHAFDAPLFVCAGPRQPYLQGTNQRRLPCLLDPALHGLCMLSR